MNPDVWAYVMAFLPGPNLLLISLVNHIFHQIVNSGHLWKQICTNEIAAGLRNPSDLSWKALYFVLRKQHDSLLPFHLVNCDGGHFSPFYEARNIHINNGYVYCSESKSNVSLVSEPLYAKEVIITGIVCKIPAGGFTSPLQCFGCVFSLEPDIQTSSNLLDEMEKNYKPSRPCEMLKQFERSVYCHFEPNETLFFKYFSRPILAKYVYTRLYSGLVPDDNIDVQFLGFIGKAIPERKEQLHVFNTWPRASQLSSRSFRHPITQEWGAMFDADSDVESDHGDAEQNLPLEQWAPMVDFEDLDDFSLDDFDDDTDDNHTLEHESP